MLIETDATLLQMALIGHGARTPNDRKEYRRNSSPTQWPPSRSPDPPNLPFSLGYDTRVPYLAVHIALASEQGLPVAALER